MKNKFLLGVVILSFLLRFDTSTAQKIDGKVLYKKISIHDNDKNVKKDNKKKR